MKKTASVRIAAVAVAGFAFSACAADAPQTGESPDLAKYNHTGKYETCIRSHEIRNSRILNKTQILFEMGGGRAYLGEANHCPGLSRDLSLVYDATIDQLCTTTIVHLVDFSTPVGQRGSCGIDRFEVLDKKKG